MSIATLKKLCADKGLEAAHLDDAVHEIASQIGSAVNNGGVDEQIRFLVENMGEDMAAKQIREIAG